jgi:hypothetical protein
MSQSDYLKYKRVATILKVDNNKAKQPPVFASQDYVNFKEFSLENTIISTNLRYNRFTVSGDVYILGMNKLVGNCATFPVCKNTHLRTNRVANSTVYFTPTPQPLNIKLQNEAANIKANIIATCNCGYVNPLSAPSTLVATASTTSVSVAFTNSTSSDGSAITNYEYSIDGGMTFTPFSPPDISSPVSITGLTTGTTYSIALRAITSTTVGPSSMTVSTTPYTVPGAPTSLVATAGDTSASIAFTAPSTGGSVITNYQYSIDNGSNYTAFSPADTASPVSITGLTNGIAYTILLKAVNAAGTSSASSSVSVTPCTVPGAPTIGTATAGNTVASIAFTPPTSTGGSVITNYQYSIDSGSTYTAFSPADTTSPVSITGLTNNTTYTVSLKAMNVAGNSTASSSVTVTPVPYVSLAGSIAYDGTIGKSLTLTPGAIIGNGAYTVECWFYNTTSWPTVSPNIRGLLGGSELGALTIFFSSNRSVRTDRYTSGEQLEYTVATDISLNAWHHFAMVRNSSMVETVFIDGVRAISSTGGTNASSGTQTNNLAYSGKSRYIGEYYQGIWSGYLTNYRIVAGTAMYDPTLTSITVPNAPLESVTNTQYLMLGGNVTLDSTSPTAQSVGNNGITLSVLKPF